NWDGELRINDSIKMVNLRATINHDNEDSVYWHGVITNITPGQTATQQLNRIISRFKTIVANIPSLIFECTLDEQENIQFTYLNEGCQALLDISPEALTDHPQRLLDMILPNDR